MVSHPVSSDRVPVEPVNRWTRCLDVPDGRKIEQPRQPPSRRTGYLREGVASASPKPAIASNCVPLALVSSKVAE